LIAKAVRRNLPSVIYFVSKKPELLKPLENNNFNIEPVKFTDAKQLKDFVQDKFPDLKKSESDLD
jgi:hypothetical protein